MNGKQNDHQKNFNDDAERGVLGGMLLDACRVVDFATNSIRLTAESFYSRVHQIIYKAIIEMVSAGRPVDVLTLADKMSKEGTLEQVGGTAYLNHLLDAIPTVAHVEYYLDIVRQHHILRGIVEQSNQLISETFSAESGDELLMSVPGRFAEIIEERSHKKSLKEHVKDVIEDWRKTHREQRGFSGLPTPWESLNELTCGLKPGLFVIAARPSQGKTTVEDQMSEFLADKGIPVARATLDMTVDRLLARMLARRSGVSLPKLNTGFAGENQLAKVTEAGEFIGEYPMWLTDELNDLTSLCTWVRALKIRHDIQLFTLDYVQQVEVGGRAAAFMNENAKITEVSKKLKQLSLELKIPFIILSQLNRGADKEERIPVISDMRGSGTLEQDASIVALLYKDKTEPDRDGKRPQWVDVAKNQDGPPGTLPFWFWANYFRFDEAEIKEGNWIRKE